jgi:hypothetical protein
MQGNQADWLDQKAYLVFEPKPLLVKLSPPGNTAHV